MKTNLTAFSIIIITSLTLYRQKILNIGDKIPEFQATADNSSNWNIGQYFGKEYIVVYFPRLPYPPDAQNKPAPAVTTADSAKLMEEAGHKALRAVINVQKAVP